MTYRGTGLATVNTEHPEAFFVCYRCGAWRNRSDVTQQNIYAGANIINTNSYVCREVSRCNDIPNPQRKAIIIPPDPYPVIPASPEFFAYSENPNNPPVTKQQILDALNADTADE